MVAFIVPPFTVPIFPVDAVKVPNTAVIAFNILVPKLPITVRLDAVVDAIVEDPLTFRLVKYPVTKAAIFPSIFVTVVEARVVEPAVRFVALRFVDVLFVIVPLVELIFVSVIPPADKLVIVALVRVAFIPIRFVTLLVDALDVDANTVVS